MPRFKYKPRPTPEQPEEAAEEKPFHKSFDEARAEYTFYERPAGEKMGPPFFEPQEWHYQTIERLAGLGINQLDICVVVGVSEHTFRIYFQDTWLLGKAQARAVAAGTLWKHIQAGNFNALQFYMRTQMGWVEKRADDPDAADKSLEQLDDDDIRREIATLEAKSSVVSEARALATRV